MQDVRQRIEQLEIELSAGAGSAAAHFKLGRLRLAAGDIDGAIAAYTRSLSGAPDASLVHNNLGVAYLNAGRHGQAIASFETAAQMNPRYLRPFVNLGKVLREVGRPREAIERLRHALELQPDYPPALVNLGAALAAVNDPQAAAAALERALSLAPDLIEANLGLIEIRLRIGRIGEAIGMCRRLLATWPANAEVHLALGRLLFLAGDWETAWPHLEYRFARASRPIALCIPPGSERWDGISQGRDLVLLGEQGLGDQIQFARYARVLRERGFATTLMCEPRLVRLLAAAGLADRVIPYNTEVGPDVRWYPLLSLAHWHGTRMDSVPLARGYLRAESGSIDSWRARMPEAACRVGLAWAGNPTAERGHLAGRSPPSAALAALGEVRDVQFISLQQGAADTAHPLGGALLRWPDLDAGPDAFLDTAAILTLLDLLITSDTSIAHLAGALGVNTWLCLHHDPDQRWMMRGDSTPWYTSMRVFRQSAPGDWQGVYRRVAGELSHWCAQRPG